MGWKKMVSITLTVIAIHSCCIPVLQKKFYTTEYGSYRPIKNKFRIANKNTKSQSKASILNNIYTRVDSVYIKKVKSKKKELKIINSFKRFFPDGQFLEGTTKDIKNGLKDYNNLKSGVIGYYKIEKNKIILEQFLVTPHDCGKYYIYELEIKEDSIEGYSKVKVKGLTGTPDW